MKKAAGNAMPAGIASADERSIKIKYKILLAKTQFDPFVIPAKQVKKEIIYFILTCIAFFVERILFQKFLIAQNLVDIIQCN
jgi:hypothetical protein